MNRIMLLLALVAISLIKTSQCLKATRGRPVPNADVLDDLLSQFLGDSYSNNVLFDYILGEPSKDRDNHTEENLDIKTLDVNNLQKIIAFAKKKYDNDVMAAQHTRRNRREFFDHAHVGYTNNELWHWHPYVINKSFTLMKHSIYMTKEKINLTRPFRNRYSQDNGYQIAILYGSAAALIVKMEAYYNQLTHMWYSTHFIWYIMIYERMLATSIDIADAIEKIFSVHEKFKELRGAKGTVPGSSKKMNLTKSEMDTMMAKPDLASKYYEKNSKK